jgi:hypothetical protein
MAQRSQGDRGQAIALGSLRRVSSLAFSRTATSTHPRIHTAGPLRAWYLAERHDEGLMLDYPKSAHACFSFADVIMARLQQWAACLGAGLTRPPGRASPVTRTCPGRGWW